MRLRDLREDNDLKQSQIAELLSIKQNTYSQYENEKREIPISLLWKLADYYNTSIDYLIGRTDKKWPSNLKLLGFLILKSQNGFYPPKPYSATKTPALKNFAIALT